MTYLGLAKRPAKDPAHRLGTIVMDPGGPGGSGVDIVKDGYLFIEPVNQRFDEVGLDPRGVGTAEQVLCDQALHDAEVDAWDPADHADLQSAYDLDAVRAALGEAKLNYVGYSYGTMMGQQYAELFPRRIRAMVNDGNLDHSIRSAWEWSRNATAVMEENFVAFA